MAVISLFIDFKIKLTIYTLQVFFDYIYVCHQDYQLTMQVCISLGLNRNTGSHKKKINDLFSVKENKFYLTVYFYFFLYYLNVISTKKNNIKHSYFSVLAFFICEKRNRALFYFFLYTQLVTVSNYFLCGKNKMSLLEKNAFSIGFSINKYLFPVLPNNNCYISFFFYYAS